jgi:hypothetical protein
VQVKVDGLSLRILAHRATAFEVGASVSVRVDADRCAVIQ